MNCPKCQQQLEDEVTSPEVSGTNEESQDSKKVSLAYKRASRSIIFIIIGIFIIAIVYFLIHSTTPAKEEQLIKNSVLEEYPSKTIGEALDEFFYNPIWIPNEETVEFNGEAYWGDEEATFTLTFNIDLENNTFSLEHYKINDIPQSDANLNLLLETIY